MSESDTSDSTANRAATALNDKQRRILRYLREQSQTNTYFKSRLIGDDLRMSAKEVGGNMPALVDGEFDVTVGSDTKRGLPRDSDP